MISQVHTVLDVAVAAPTVQHLGLVQCYCQMLSMDLLSFKSLVVDPVQIYSYAEYASCIMH